MRDVKTIYETLSEDSCFVENTLGHMCDVEIRFEDLFMVNKCFKFKYHLLEMKYF